MRGLVFVEFEVSDGSNKIVGVTIDNFIRVYRKAGQCFLTLNVKCLGGRTRLEAGWPDTPTACTPKKPVSTGASSATATTFVFCLLTKFMRQGSRLQCQVIKKS